MKETKIVIVTHDEAVALSEKTEKVVPQIRLEESLKRSIILPEKFHQPVRLCGNSDGELDFSISGVLIGRNQPRQSFDIIVKSGRACIECDDIEVYQVISKVISGCMDANSFLPLTEVVEGGIYRHYKGGIYEVLCIATHTESSEEQVIYKGKTRGRIWARPKAMFMDGRFQPLE